MHQNDLGALHNNKMGKNLNSDGDQGREKRGGKIVREMAEGTLETTTICNFKLFGLLSCVRTFSIASKHLDIV